MIIRYQNTVLINSFQNLPLSMALKRVIIIVSYWHFIAMLFVEYENLPMALF